MLDKMPVQKNSALAAMLATVDVKPENEVKAEKEKDDVKPVKRLDPKKVNPQGYKRNRGKGGTKPMSYYLPDEIIKAINIKAANEGMTKSEVVLLALKLYLKDELKEAV